MICNTNNRTEMTELAKPVVWGGASEGSPQFETHKGLQSMDLMTSDNLSRTNPIPGVFYSSTARLNALSTTDLKKAGPPGRWIRTN